MAETPSDHTQTAQQHVATAEQLVASRGPLPRARLLDLLQPPTLVENQNSAENVLQAAKQCDLVTEQRDTVHLAVEPQQVATPTAFQTCMRRVTLGVTDDTRPNYLFNLYAAWYCVRGEQTLFLSRKEFETRFNEDLFAREEERRFNTQKFAGWLQWAAYLGLGWLMRQPGVARGDILAPDSSMRIEPLLDELLGKTARQPVPFADFANQLGRLCPELDGGVLYERCWRAVHANAPHGNRLSLALSTGLRVLHQTGTIELICTTKLRRLHLERLLRSGKQTLQMREMKLHEPEPTRQDRPSAPECVATG